MGEVLFCPQVCQHSNIKSKKMLQRNVLTEPALVDVGMYINLASGTNNQMIYGVRKRTIVREGDEGWHHWVVIGNS
jgi:hypothetical protein